MNEVFYKVNLNNLKCDFIKQNSIEKYNKEINMTMIKNIFFTIDKDNNLVELLNDIKFEDCVDTYYSDEYGIYFYKKDLSIINPKIVVEVINKFSILEYEELYEKIKKINNNDKKENRKILFKKIR